MNAFIILVCNGPTVIVTHLDIEKTVSNLLWRGFQDFNLYQVPERNIEQLQKSVGERTWRNTMEELNDEWPVRVVNRDSSRSFHDFQLYAGDTPVAKIRNRGRLSVQS